MKHKYILILDLVDEEASIQQYEAYHEQIPDEITKSITDSGIESMEIYRFGNRLVMEIIANETFSFDTKSKADHNNEAVQAWESLMNNYQQRIPGSQPHEKWVLTKRIFSLIN
ncbi:L-rhamnose mutarotase [Aquirufa sp. TARAVU-A1A]